MLEMESVHWQASGEWCPLSNIAAAYLLICAHVGCMPGQFFCIEAHSRMSQHGAA